MTPYPPPERKGLTSSELAVERNGNTIVGSVSLQLPAGTASWLDGPSGAGKTSLLMALARLLPFYRGKLFLGGTPWDRIKAPAWRRRVVFVPQPPIALAETVEEDLTAPFRLRRYRDFPVPAHAGLKEEMGRLGLGHLPLDQPTGELSQGQMARLVILRALLVQPDVLLLDEPTANLDPTSEGRIAERIASFSARGGAVLVAAHAAPWPFVSRRYRIAGGRLETVSTP